MVLAIALAAVLAQSGCKRTDAAAANAPPPAPVTVAAAQTRDMPVELHAVGHVEARRTVNVTSRVDGQIVAVSFQEGADVAAGATLFQLDPRPFQAQLDAARAKEAQDRAQYENSRRNDVRNLDLVAKNFISPQAFENQRTTTQTYDAMLQGDRAAIDAARLNLEYSTIRAPIAGRTGKILVQLGNQVRATDASPLVTLNEVSPVYVAFAVPERYLAGIRARQARQPQAVEVTTQDASVAQGVLTFLDNSVDPTTGTITLRATFSNADRRLWPQQFVDVTLVLAEEPGAIVIPDVAVQAGPAGRYVWVVRADATVEQRRVVVDRTQGGLAVVASGLAAGERVVVSGALRLAPGVRAQIVDQGLPS